MSVAFWDVGVSLDQGEKMLRKIFKAKIKPDESDLDQAKKKLDENIRNFLKAIPGLTFAGRLNQVICLAMPGYHIEQEVIYEKK